MADYHRIYTTETTFSTVGVHQFSVEAGNVIMGINAKYGMQNTTTTMVPGCSHESF